MQRIIENVPKTSAHQIKSDCLQFYITTLEETQRRLPLNDKSIFKEMEFLNPEVAIGNSNKSVHRFNLLYDKYKVDVNLLTQEWLTLEYTIIFLNTKSNNYLN